MKTIISILIILILGAFAIFSCILSSRKDTELRNFIKQKEEMDENDEKLIKEIGGRK